MGLETCNNCERTIGNLEQAYVYNDKTVCKECNALLHIKTNDEPASNSKTIVNVKPYKKVQTIEKTGKQFKAGMLAGVIMMLVAIPVACGGDIGGCVILGLMGMCIFIISDVLAWWHHG
jgi:hypothetical protein